MGINKLIVLNLNNFLIIFKKTKCVYKMKKIKTIVVPLDFSYSSFEAVKYASFFAKAHNSRIFLINIIPGLNYFYTYPDTGVSSAHIIGMQRKMNDEMKENSLKRLKYTEDTKYLKNLQVKSEVIMGTDIYSDIISYAQSKNADLIVMGTKGNTSFKKAFLGSKTERVIRFTKIPVLAIRGKVGVPKIKKVVFASDFTTESYSVYPTLNNLVKEFDPVIHLLKINTKNQFRSFKDNKGDLDRFIKRFSGKFVPHVRANYEIDEGITNFARLNKADLIAIGLRRKKGPRRVLGNRIAEGIIRLTGLPVLAIDIP